MKRKTKVMFPNLVAEMARNGENQRVIAELLGLNYTTISKKLNGQIGWSIGEVEKICEHYKKDYYKLFK